MPNWLLEMIMVWNYRSRSLNLFTLGLISYFFISFLADWLMSDFSFTGPMKGLESVVTGKISGVVDWRGLVVMIGCWKSAIECYIKDKKHLDKHF